MKLICLTIFTYGSHIVQQTGFYSGPSKDHSYRSILTDSRLGNTSGIHRIPTSVRLKQPDRSKLFTLGHFVTQMSDFDRSYFPSLLWIINVNNTRSVICVTPWKLSASKFSELSEIFNSYKTENRGRCQISTCMFRSNNLGLQIRNSLFTLPNHVNILTVHTFMCTSFASSNTYTLSWQKVAHLSKAGLKHYFKFTVLCGSETIMVILKK